MKLLIAKILLLSGFSFSAINCHAEGNLLLDRNFWKERPSLEQVQNAVDEGHDPAQLDQYAFDALSWALIENSSIEIQTYLLNLPGNSVNKLTHDGRTYIFWAAYRNNLPFMEHLINAGAKTNIIDDHGYSLLNFAAVTGQTSIELFDFIIEHGADPILETNRNGANALLLLMPFLENGQLIKYFESKGLSLQDTDYDGSNAYHYASKGGNIDLLEKLEDKGLNPKKVNKKKMNAFHFASMGMRGHSNNIEVFNYLEKSRVDETFTLLIKPLESISFESGDLLGVSPEESKREQERLYSISKTIDNNILLSIRLFSGGLVSPFLEHLEEFDSFWARIISNPSFHLTKDESPLLMISNGTGIVPFIGMLNNSGKRDAHLFWGGRSKKHQTLYDAWLDRVLGRNKNFRFYPAYSRTANGIYVQNLLADESEKVMELWNQNCTVMICGSLAMQREVLLCLEKLIPDINEKSLPHLKKERRLQKDCY
jgi:ferredoxin-NADP reductase/ankyrin repeat protein